MCVCCVYVCMCVWDSVDLCVFDFIFPKPGATFNIMQHCGLQLDLCLYMYVCTCVCVYVSETVPRMPFDISLQNQEQLSTLGTAVVFNFTQLLFLFLCAAMK